MRIPRLNDALEWLLMDVISLSNVAGGGPLQASLHTGAPVTACIYHQNISSW